MRLVNAAKHFDRLVVADAYDDSNTFKVQFDLFDDARRDGLSVDRRIVSMHPDVTIPARRTFTADGQTWIIGETQTDYFDNDPIRRKYVVQLSQGVTIVNSFNNALSASIGLSTYASRIWVKTSKEVDTSSLEIGNYDIYFQHAENLALSSLIFLQGRWHLIRSLYPSAAGFLVAVADELPEPVVTTATFTSRVYVPLTDTYTDTPVAIPAVRIHWQSHYKYPSRATESYKSGDVVCVVRKSDVTPKSGDTLGIAGETLRVISVLDENPCWTLHLRHG